MLNQRSPIPLYRQLADRIRDDIDSGVHAVAEKIPSENELANRFSIGRPTVRQATDLLVRQGMLERRRGSGTFVLPPSRSIDLFSLTGTSAALRKSELNACLELTIEPRHEYLKLNAEHKNEADVQPDAQDGKHNSTRSANAAVKFLRIERCAKVEGTPVLYETIWLSTDLFPDIQNHNLANQSLSALVRDVYFLEPSSADQTFFVISANDEQAKQLQTSTGAALLHVHRELHFGNNKSALHSDIVCLTDRFEFSQTLYPAHANQE